MRDFCYWTMSRVVREEIGSVPLRPQNNRPNPRGRKYYKPWFVSGRNCASNIGILHVLTTICNEYQHLHAQRKYGYFKADVAIFLKFIQIAYSEHCPYNRNRLFLCPILEYFHPFKHGAESVWQQDRFLRCFIAPFLHTFVPESGIRWNSKLQMVNFFIHAFSFVDGGYIYFDAIWMGSLSTTFPQFTPLADDLHAKHLRNLIFLMDFCIPLVSFLFSLSCFVIYFTYFNQLL